MSDIEERVTDRRPGRLQVSRPERQIMVEAARRLRKEATRSEELLWRSLRGGRLEGFKFRRQHTIGSFVVDFCCVAQRLVIEVDGAVHATQVERDEYRQELLEMRGYRFLRVTATEVEEDLQGVVERIGQALLPSPPGPLSRATGEGEIPRVEI